MPEVRRQVPDAELLLVGQGTPSWLESEFDGLEGVVATGQVDDVRPYLHRAWVSVLPLRRAGGSQIKVMEALAAGVPVVTTSPVAAALGVDEQDGVVVAGGIKGIATAVTRLLRDSDRRRSLSQLGEKTAKLRFDREPAALLQEEAWLEALSRVRQMNPAAGVAL
jgi:glycosyltransferase involved in cell wall biosynthesis